jgi:hypothetical protein
MPNTRKPSSERKKILIGKANKRRWAERRMLERLKADYVVPASSAANAAAANAAVLKYIQRRGNVKTWAEYRRAKRQIEAETGTPMLGYDKVMLWIKSVVKIQMP